jgi:hypothetical protein
MANTIGGYGNNLANIAMGTGANYNPNSTGQTSQVTGMLGSAGQSAVAGGIAGALPSGGGAGAGALAALGLSSDVRLKENIKRVGTTPNGHNWYNWDWNEKGQSIAKDQPSYGVLAQEVAEIDPSAIIIGDDGYLRVDYSKV